VRLALVLNPRSGSVGDPDALVEQFRRRAEHVTVHAPGEAQAAVAESPDRLVVVGGDGTIGDAFAAAASADLPLAVIPAGTANDFARALELPLDHDAALELACDPAASTAPTWGGRIAGRPFVNVASVGLAVDAAERAEALKHRLGPLAYAVGAAHAGIVGRTIDASITVDGELEEQGAVFQLLVGASGRFGGGSGLGEAAPDDPRLVAAWVPGGSRLELPLRAIGLRRRTIEQQTGVEWWRGTRLEVHARLGARPAPWNIDGERWRPGEQPVTLEPLGPVRVIRP
jgi:diacylglycerol kinase family enzyme